MQLLYYVLFALLGLAFGSFSTVLVSRVPEDEPITGRSHCPKCKRQLRVIDLIPVLSYVLLGGKCAGCSKQISLKYPLIELSMMGIFLLSALLDARIWVALSLAFALLLLFVISVIDFSTKTIADALNVPFVILAVLYNYFEGPFSISGMLLIGGFFGVLFLLGRGRWIGSGDIPLGIGIGALCGDWRFALTALFITYVGGAVILSSLLLSGKVSRKDHVPFAPLLAMGAFAVVAFRGPIEELLVWYSYFL